MTLKLVLINLFFFKFGDWKRTKKAPLDSSTFRDIRKTRLGKSCFVENNVAHKAALDYAPGIVLLGIRWGNNKTWEQMFGSEYILTAVCKLLCSSVHAFIVVHLSVQGLDAETWNGPNHCWRSSRTLHYVVTNLLSKMIGIDWWAFSTESVRYFIHWQNGRKTGSLHKYLINREESRLISYETLLETTFGVNSDDLHVVKFIAGKLYLSETIWMFVCSCL